MRTPARKRKEQHAPPIVEPLTEREAEAFAEVEPDVREAGRWGAAEEPAGPLPMVAIVGRPNVGKSTLFNRIIGRRKALVHDRPGMTRDRNMDRAVWDGLDFLCVDTGGFETELDDPLLANVVEQVRLAIDEADLVILLAAVRETAHPADAEILRLLRAANKPFVAAVNKCDSTGMELEATDFYRYGLERVYPIAALHGHGVADLLSDAVARLRELEPAPRDVAVGGIRLAVVGRQNVGKSTLVNRLAGEERVIANALAGTTRDAIDTVVTSPEGRRFTLIDTAGIRRRGKVQRGVEKLSVLSSMFSLERCDVAALLIDAAEGLTDQDAHIAGYCVDAGRALMILVNKWDAIEKDGQTADRFTKHLQEQMAFISYAPVLYVSALSGQRVTRVFEVAEAIYANATRRVPTHELNEHLARWVARKPPPMARNRRPKIRYITQRGVQPPRFTLFVNDPTLFHFSYNRYLINRMREAWDFEGTPVRLSFRQNRSHKLPEGAEELEET